MIRYQKEKRLLVLDNGSITYAVYMNDAGSPETVYFGDHLADDDLLASRIYDENVRYYDVATGELKCYADRTIPWEAPCELSSNGLADKRGGPVILRDEQGSTVTDFRFVGVKKYKNAPSVADMPHAHGVCETADVLFEDAHHRVRAHLLLTLFPDKDVLLKSIRLENKGRRPVRIDRAMSMQLDLPRMDYDLVHFHGRWAMEREVVTTPLAAGTLEVASNYGRSSAEANPFFFLKEHGATFDRGTVIGCNLIYSGNFKLRASVGAFRGVHLLYGMNDEDFSWELAPGAAFDTPQAVLAYSQAGIDGMSQTMHRFVRENLMTYAHDRDYKPLLFNSWEGCYFTFDTDLILSYIDDAAKVGTELFVLDDGWFGARDHDRAGLGDWRVNGDKIDLHAVMARCRERGMKFGIWFEPEMINADSDLFRAHPEYVLGWGREQLSLSRNQLCLDFSNPAVVDNIYGQMKAFLDEYPVDYIKWDYNRTVAEHLSRAWPMERQGEVYHRLVLGYYALLGRLTAEYPHTMFEGCASGGGRFDLGTLYYCPQIWASDESDPAQRMYIQFNTSLGYPLSSIGAHVNDSKVASYSTKAALALFGSYGCEMNPNVLTEGERAELAAAAAIYRQYHRDVIMNGTLWHLYAPYEGNYMAMQCVSQAKDASLVLFMNKRKELEQFRFLRLKGLDPRAKYQNDLDGGVHTGAYYMQVGLNLSRPWLPEFSHKLVLLTRVE